MCVRARRRWRSQEEEEEERKNPRITKESLRRICKEQNLYITPHLNDVLYLHYKGYSKIENLEEYTGLKCLWLENNGIDKIENLDNQKDLRNLYLHNNLIKEIENLEGACPLLDSLNLCHNSVSKIQNLSRLIDFCTCKLEHLHTLHISHNRLQDFADVEHLKECKELSCVDLQHNWLDDPNIVDIFEAMPSLRVLYLTGNPVVKKIPSYRKNLTVRCKKLTYLDDRPVFPKDRAAAEAWSEGGLEAEKACRKKWADEERAKIDASVKGLLALRDKANAAKFKEEMLKLIPDSELQKEDTEDDEAKDKEEESDKESEYLGAGDSEDVVPNGIIFPWNVDEDSTRRKRNGLGEGGRSLIVELPDPDQTENKKASPLTRKSLKNPEIQNKLHEALLSAEWLQENNADAEQPKQETKPKTEMSEPETEVPNSETEMPQPEDKTVKEILQEEEIEKGSLDNLIKEKKLSYEKYIKKAEEEILPNISHFTFGPPVKEEKSLGLEIEELLRLEKEEMEKAKEANEEQREETRKQLIESTTLESRQTDGEVDGTFKNTINLLDESKLLDERKAIEVIENGVKVIEEFNSIGKLPLQPRENGRSESSSSSDNEFEDVEEEPIASQIGRIKESQESEEYYSFVTEDEEEDSHKTHEQDEPETCIRAYKKNVTSSIELQIVAEADVEAKED